MREVRPEPYPGRVANRCPKLGFVEQLQKMSLGLREVRLGPALSDPMGILTFSDRNQFVVDEQRGVGCHEVHIARPSRADDRDTEIHRFGEAEPEPFGPVQ